MRSFEFGGGLGDILNDIYRYNGYAALQGAPQDEDCRVSIISHNPAVRELFEHWPSSPKMHITEYGYWTPEQDAEMRRKHGLPKPVQEQRPDWATFTFHNHPGDAEVLAELPDKYVVFSVSAGEPSRSFPDDLVSETLNDLLFELSGPEAVFVGRNYERNGRPKEIEWIGTDTSSFIDRISIPATLNVVRDPRCKGVICAHSSISMLAGWENKPQLLLYDKATRQRHFERRDQWSWYAFDRDNVFHSTFGNWQEAAEKFFSHIIK